MKRRSYLSSYLSVWIPLLLLALVTGCSEDPKEEPAPVQSDDSDLVLVNLSLKISDEDLEKMSAEKQVIYHAINNGRRLSHKFITKLYLEEEQARYGEVAESLAKEDVAAFLGVLSNDVGGQASVYDAKEKWESNLTAYHHDEVPQYDMEAANPMFAMTQNRYQCFSGTKLDLTSHRLSQTGAEFEQNHHVVIFESGHSLPGQVVASPSGELRLYGRETDYLGPALVDFGLTHEMDRNGSPAVRVVLATEFFVVEIYKTVLTNLKEVALQAIKNAHERYTINSLPLPGGVGIAGLGDGLSAGPGDVSSASLLDSTPFAFGSAPRVPPRRRTRKETVTTRGAFQHVSPAKFAAEGSRTTISGVSSGQTPGPKPAVQEEGFAQYVGEWRSQPGPWGHQWNPVGLWVEITSDGQITSEDGVTIGQIELTENPFVDELVFDESQRPTDVEDGPLLQPWIGVASQGHVLFISSEYLFPVPEGVEEEEFSRRAEGAVWPEFLRSSGPIVEFRRIIPSAVETETD